MALVCDRAFQPYAAYLAAEILRAHPDPGFDVAIVGPDIVALPPAIGPLRVVRVDGDNPFRHLVQARRRVHAAYLRLLLPELLPEYCCILYLDCDIALNGPLAEAFGHDLHGQALGAVRDNQQWRTPSRRVSEFARAGLSATRYLNSGVLLFDAALWRRQGWSGRCIKAASDPSLAHAFTRNDQSALNLALRGGWTELSPVWNWQWMAATRLLADDADARLIHFIGPKKPWRTDAIPPRFSRGYGPFLAAHFGGEPPSPSAPGPRDLAPLAQPLLKHWLRLRATRTDLGRFPDPNVTHPPE